MNKKSVQEVNEEITKILEDNGYKFQVSAVLNTQAVSIDISDSLFRAGIQLRLLTLPEEESL